MTEFGSDFDDRTLADLCGTAPIAPTLTDRIDGMPEWFTTGFASLGFVLIVLLVAAFTA